MTVIRGPAQAESAKLLPGKKMWGRVELRIGKWGNSLRIRLLKVVLEAFHLGAKDRWRIEYV
jgi:hypothetical protein